MTDSPIPAESDERQRDKVKELFDDRAEQYFREREQDHGFVTQKAIVLNLFDKDGGRVLDIGCGPAVMTADLLRRGCTVWGIDVSERMIDLAITKMAEHDQRSNAHFSVGDIENLEFLKDELELATYTDTQANVEKYGLFEYMSVDDMDKKLPEYDLVIPF